MPSLGYERYKWDATVRGLGGHANTNDGLVAAARKQIAELQAKASGR
jgi:hypothetical protein